MKSRFIRILWIAGVMVSVLVISPNSYAHPNPVTKLKCVVRGSVALGDSTVAGYGTGPALNNVRHTPGDYNFVQTSLTCNGTYAGFQVDTAVYSVTAFGTTQGINPKHDEDCEQGQDNHDGLLNATKTSEVTAAAPAALAGRVRFTRLGTAVAASGPLWAGANLAAAQAARGAGAGGAGNVLRDVWFDAPLVFTPDPPESATNCPNGGAPPGSPPGVAGISNADLTGTASVRSS